MLKANHHFDPAKRENVAGHDLICTNQNLVISQSTGKVARMHKQSPHHTDYTLHGGHDGSAALAHYPIVIKDGVEYVSGDGGHQWHSVAEFQEFFPMADFFKETVNRG
jgi:hypothetical protein